MKRIYPGQTPIIDRTLEILGEIGYLDDETLISESRKKLVTFLDNVLDPETKSILNEIQIVEYTSSKFKGVGKNLRNTLQESNLEIRKLYKYTSYYYCYILTGKKNFSLD